MIVLFDRSFSKNLDKLKNNLVKVKLLKLIEQCEKATTLQSITGLKKLKGFSNHYRFRIGDYRIGIELIDTNTILFVIVAHRREIYNVFP